MAFTVSEKEPLWACELRGKCDVDLQGSLWLLGGAQGRRAGSRVPVRRLLSHPDRGCAAGCWGVGWVWMCLGILLDCLGVRDAGESKITPWLLV